MIWTIELMLEHLGEHDAAACVLTAIREVIKDKSKLTSDLGGHARTSEVGDFVCGIIREG